MIKLIKKYGLTSVLVEVEKMALESVIHLSNSEAAKVLKLPITTYRSKVKKFKIKK
jgi:DNA-binding protein Fis